MRIGPSELNEAELESLDLQLKMLAYQTLDTFDEKQKIKGAVRLPGMGQETTYLNLIMETFISQY